MEAKVNTIEKAFTEIAHLLLPSEFKNLVMVEKAIDELFSDYQFGDELYGRVMVASHEAVSNAIIHGNEKDPFRTVDIRFLLNDENLVIMVEDQGEGFDYEDVQDPTNPGSLIRSPGRGMFLMKNLSDKIIFINNGRKIRMEFQL